MRHKKLEKILRKLEKAGLVVETLQVNPEGFEVYCPELKSKRKATDCWVPNGQKCKHFVRADIVPDKDDPEAPRIAIYCNYSEKI